MTSFLDALVQKLEQHIDNYLRTVENIVTTDGFQSTKSPIVYCLKIAKEKTEESGGDVNLFFDHFKGCLLEMASILTRVAIETTNESVKKSILESTSSQSSGASGGTAIAVKSRMQKVKISQNIIDRII